MEQWYSTRVYPVIQQILTPISNLVPFALLDVLLIAALCTAIVVLVRGVRQARRKNGWRPILITLARLVTTSALIYLLFLAIWGLNYRRVPMAERLVLDRSASPQAILELGRTSVRQLNALHSSAHAEGWRTSPWRERRMRDAFDEVLVRLSDAGPAVPGRLKSSLLGPYFRWTTVDGMINPFGLEAIANPDLLPFERPFVAAHEWAHLAGYADESEASFVGFLTCIRASHARSVQRLVVSLLANQLGSRFGRPTGARVCPAGRPASRSRGDRRADAQWRSALVAGRWLARL